MVVLLRGIAGLLDGALYGVQAQFALCRGVKVNVEYRGEGHQVHERVDQFFIGGLCCFRVVDTGLEGAFTEPLVDRCEVSIRRSVP